MKIYLFTLLLVSNLAFAGGSKYNCSLSKLNKSMKVVDSITKSLEVDEQHVMNDISFPEFQERYQIQAEATGWNFADSNEITVRISKNDYSAFNDEGNAIKLQNGEDTFALSCTNL